MAIFKCKMCGGDLEITTQKGISRCMYCNTLQTIPKIDTTEKETLYSRGNHFRLNSEYDKAESVYERILEIDNTDAETYWSLVLCKFGIEYVEDPATKKRIPTINRMQNTSILADQNYKAAIKYADPNQKKLYFEEVKKIAKIQEEISAIATNEDPFDVFICYKETDKQGRRTQDSVLANEIYHQLTNEGFKVFFSRITLEDKIGTAYEPYIFSALNTAKVMIVLGTDKDYFVAPWVKNEWSRFLAQIKGGAKKALIPAYKNMDPYDLPEEFSNLQAQNMSTLGFMQDLIRGIKKILAVNTPVQNNATQQQNTANLGGQQINQQYIDPKNSIKTLLDRVDIFLEQQNFIDANNYCEKVLDIEPKNTDAYFRKYLAENKFTSQDDLLDKILSIKSPLTSSKSFAMALKFADEDKKQQLQYLIDIQQLTSSILVDYQEMDSLDEKISNEATNISTNERHIIDCENSIKESQSNIDYNQTHREDIQQDFYKSKDYKSVKQEIRTNTIKLLITVPIYIAAMFLVIFAAVSLASDNGGVFLPAMIGVAILDVIATVLLWSGLIGFDCDDGFLVLLVSCFITAGLVGIVTTIVVICKNKLKKDLKKLAQDNYNSIDTQISSNEVKIQENQVEIENLKLKIQNSKSAIESYKSNLKTLEKKVSKAKEQLKSIGIECIDTFDNNCQYEPEEYFSLRLRELDYDCQIDKIIEQLQRWQKDSSMQKYMKLSESDLLQLIEIKDNYAVYEDPDEFTHLDEFTFTYPMPYAYADMVAKSLESYGAYVEIDGEDDYYPETTDEELEKRGIKVKVISKPTFNAKPQIKNTTAQTKTTAINNSQNQRQSTVQTEDILLFDEQLDDNYAVILKGCNTQLKTLLIQTLIQQTHYSNEKCKLMTEKACYVKKNLTKPEAEQLCDALKQAGGKAEVRKI